MSPAEDIRDRLDEFVGQPITIYLAGIRPVSGLVHEVFDDFVVLKGSSRRFNRMGLTERLLVELGKPDLISHDTRWAFAVTEGDVYADL